MKVLNLYCGIGGNRKLWEDVEVTAIEINPDIATIYQDFFPGDKVIVTDAHQYLLHHINDGWNFIWSSPPCQSHSSIRNATVNKPLRDGTLRPQKRYIYPDMKLYEEIILLTHHFNEKWVVENVRSYYTPLLKPHTVGRHYIWANFYVTKMENKIKQHFDNIPKLIKIKGFNISKYDIKDKRKVLRNCVLPKIGLHIFNCAFKYKQSVIFSSKEARN